MRRFRRVTALIVSLLLVQLALAGSGHACATHARHGQGGHSAMMSAGAHASGVMPGAGGGAIGDELSCGGPLSHMPCGLPGNGGSCVGPGACATALLGGADATPSKLSVVHSTLLADRVLSPPTRTLAPELPPPRA